MNRSLARHTLLASLALAAACSPDRATSPVAAKPVPVTISASLTTAQQALVKGLSVEVTGPGIATPIVANLDVAAATVNGTVQLPTGANRLITVHAFDAAAIETYRGSTTVTVRRGTNLNVTVTLLPLAGGQPITVALGTYAMALTPAAPSVGVAQTATLTLAIAGASGESIAPLASEVQWGSGNPMIASVTVDPANPAQATITGLLQGTTTIAAAYKGVAVNTTVTVNPPPIAFTQIAAGYGFTCGLDTGGKAWCWGQNGAGQLGDGNTLNSARPVAVTGGLSFTTLSLGGFHACGITTGGAAYCWGDGIQGALGDGASTTRLSPVAVAGGHLFSAIAAGFDYSCGLTADGTLLCWGANGYTLGVTNSPQGSLVTTAPAPVSHGEAMSAVFAGGSVSCALTVSKTGACWGNIDANVGTSAPGFVTALFPSTTWKQMTVGRGSYAMFNFNGTTFPVYSTGEQFVCGLTSSGTARCWGANSYGELGNESTSPSSALVTVKGSQDFTTLGAGAGFACGLRTDASLACWGNNADGQLGNGGVSAGTPSTVLGGYMFTGVAAGVRHACGLRVDGAVLCWGSNGAGELGDGSTNSSAVPVLVKP